MPPEPLIAEWKDGRGLIVGFCPRGRKKEIVAVVLCRHRLHDVPLKDIRIVKIRRKK